MFDYEVVTNYKEDRHPLIFEVKVLDALKFIQGRQSSRGPYNSGQKVAKLYLLQILEAARWAPTPHNMQNFEIVIVDDVELLEQIVNLKHSISQSNISENFRNSDAYASSEEELIRKNGYSNTHL